MAIYLFEPREVRERFSPLTRTRNLSDLLLGGISIIDWWRLTNEQHIYVITEDYLQEFIPAFIEPGDTLIHASTFPVSVDVLFNDFPNTVNGVGLWIKGQEFLGGVDNEHIAVRVEAQMEIEAIRKTLFKSADPNLGFEKLLASSGQKIDWITKSDLVLLRCPEELLAAQRMAIDMAIKLITQRSRNSEAGSETREVDSSNMVKGDFPVILSEGAILSMAFLNTENGPIYIGKDATVMEGAMIRGPIFLGDRSTIKMGARIYGPVVTGSNCVLGGEIKNVVFHSGSNKSHDGYLGDSIIGSWCNFGAGSGGSNVKNTGGPVRLYDYQLMGYREVGLKFGALVGDYCRIGVGTQLNTGSNIGVCSNVFGQDMPPKMTPDFSWGTGRNISEYQFEKAISHIDSWMQFKQEQLTDKEIQILHHIFELARNQD